MRLFTRKKLIKAQNNILKERECELFFFHPSPDDSNSKLLKKEQEERKDLKKILLA